MHETKKQGNLLKNMFHLDDEKIEIALGNKALVFWQGKKAENVVFFISDVEIRGIYLSLVYLS